MLVFFLLQNLSVSGRVKAVSNLRFNYRDPLVFNWVHNLRVLNGDITFKFILSLLEVLFSFTGTPHAKQASAFTISSFPTAGLNKCVIIMTDNV